MKKAALHNLGCKVNAYETEAMQEMLREAGYEIVPFGERADVYIINTCTVTNMADRKSRQMLHKARKLNPDAVVVAAGCYVQTGGSETDPAVDIVVGNNKKREIVSILEAYEAEKAAKAERAAKAEKAAKAERAGENVSRGEEKEAEQKARKRVVIDMNRTREYEELNLSRTAEHTRAYIKVQDGCNQFCSYCIIPYARGRVRSRKSVQVLEEVRRLASGGYKEIVLTGIHLSSYGMDTGENLLSLIQSVHEVEGIQRIRLGSLEPRIITEEFAEALRGLEKLCPHFHLSLQSGCDETLRRMNRRYTSGEYREKCAILRRYFTRPALTTDVILGFPGETQGEFEQSKAFIDEMNFYETHIFKYSRREGTKAAAMDCQVPEEIKTKRSTELLALGNRKREAYEAALIGTVQEILVEEELKRPDGIYQVGHTKEYVKIGRKTSENYVNQLINVEITNASQIIH